ncbi:hypothetical protein CLV51_1021072 [Chitinophaga niastensis]|uniref:Uncharacterized protein n=1 Tax=Chitinophaga niastensis TaxID=536980 RepID=A0A2P8HPQ5_CHINA|nr:hypothetical protein CLV51_1021072 [Chitinophaga niastensis]
MINSRILLGAATFILAIAGAISTMGSNRNINGRVLTVNKIVCTLINCNCGINVIGPLCTTMTALHRTIWTLNSNCQVHKLYRIQ